MDLHPTYFYDRFYFPGQQLKRHSDRPACEVSVSYKSVQHSIILGRFGLSDLMVVSLMLR
jgi:hypothetical protein